MLIKSKPRILVCLYTAIFSEGLLILRKPNIYMFQMKCAIEATVDSGYFSAVIFVKINIISHK